MYFYLFFFILAMPIIWLGYAFEERLSVGFTSFRSRPVIGLGVGVLLVICGLAGIGYLVANHALSDRIVLNRFDLIPLLPLFFGGWLIAAGYPRVVEKVSSPETWLLSREEWRLIGWNFIGYLLAHVIARSITPPDSPPLQHLLEALPAAVLLVSGLVLYKFWPPPRRASRLATLFLSLFLAFLVFPVAYELANKLLAVFFTR